MATAGDADFCGSVTEEFEYKHTCLACESEGKMQKAVGYCQNCQEYLCQRCYDVHLIPLQMRRHVIVDEENMPDIANAEATNNECSEPCPQHPKEVIKYHCPTHSFFGCHVCCFKHQKSCTDVQYIPEVSQNITGTTEYQDFNNRVAKITEKGSQLITDINTATETNNTCHTKAVAGIKDFKKELLDAIEKLEKELLEKADSAKTERAAELSKLADKVNNVLKENQKITSKTEILLNKHQHCDLYTAMVQLKDKLLTLEDDLHAAAGDKRSEYILEYASNKELLESLKSPSGLGNLNETGVMTEVKAVITDVKHLRDVNCKTETDTSDCRFVGSVVLPGDKLVLIDESNRKVKLLDARQNKVVADLKVGMFPLGVCRVTNTQVAVAISSKQRILLVGTQPSMSISRELKMDGTCRGVGYLEGKLVVSYNSPSKVEILDLQGTFLRKIETDDKGQSLFSDPFHLTINPYNKLIYVSNFSLHNIVCMKLDGTIVAKYTDSELQGPWQVITDKTGKMLACDRSSKNVHQITDDCKKVRVLLTKAQGLISPESIAYSEKDDTIYIGQDSNDLKVFKLTFKTQ